MIVGFTGTRYGMTKVQCVAFEVVYIGLCVRELHHGDCVGADAEAAAIAHYHRSPASPVRIVCHPPLDGTHRAFFAHSDEVFPARHYLARNRAIVDACDVLIGCPFERECQPRGGTWSTIRYARTAGKHVIVIAPDGTVEDSGAVAS